MAEVLPPLHARLGSMLSVVVLVAVGAVTLGAVLLVATGSVAGRLLLAVGELSVLLDIGAAVADAQADRAMMLMARILLKIVFRFMRFFSMDND